MTPYLSVQQEVRAWVSYPRREARLGEWLQHHPAKDHPETYLIGALLELLADIEPW